MLQVDGRTCLDVHTQLRALYAAGRACLVQKLSCLRCRASGGAEYWLMHAWLGWVAARSGVQQMNAPSQAAALTCLPAMRRVLTYNRRADKGLSQSSPAKGEIVTTSATSTAMPVLFQVHAAEAVSSCKVNVNNN